MNTNSDLPITALCIVSDRSKCPPNYTPIYRSHDTNTETDLWKDGLFGRKINRFICYTKDYPIQETYNVIEDIKILNEKETLGGFIPVDKCLDSGEKSFQKKVLFIKVSHRFFTQTAVSDIIILIRSKRAPYGYSYIGDINGQSICIKFSQIPTNTSGSANQIKQAIPPPIPPRPNSIQTLNEPFMIIDQDYVHVKQSALPEKKRESINYNNEFSNINRSLSSNHSMHNNFNPLQGVPFEINPVYDILRTNSLQNELIDSEKINRKMLFLNETLEKIDYDFNLERSCLSTI